MVIVPVVVALAPSPVSMKVLPLGIGEATGEGIGEGIGDSTADGVGEYVGVVEVLPHAANTMAKAETAPTTSRCLIPSMLPPKN